MIFKDPRVPLSAMTLAEILQFLELQVVATDVLSDPETRVWN